MISAVLDIPVDLLRSRHGTEMRESSVNLIGSVLPGAPEKESAPASPVIVLLKRSPALGAR